MCGIAGFLHFNRQMPCDMQVLQRMTRTLQHRGPDGEGYLISANVALGHRRLAIIDLSTGDQPMQSEDGSLTVIFNGEIYNYVELREELIRRGYRFRTTSDTEVILAAYQEWDTECVKHFNGMWAFALWDGGKRRLFCSRDRVGEKPFYYAVTDDAFVFGSEIKALFSFGVPKHINVEALDAYLCFTYVPGKETFFKGIYKLQPAHSIVVNAGGVRESCYWEFNIPDEQEARTDELQIFREFESLFENAVAIRMRSDVPFGAFLSGGLDSGCVVGVMSTLSNTPIQTCTIGFENRDFDERELARLVARRFRTDHTERMVRPVDTEEILSKLAWHYDEPFGDSSALPAYLVSQIARERVTMVLTGDGGDEVTSGYTIHLGEKIASFYSLLPPVVGKALLGASSFVGRHFGRGSAQSVLSRLQRVLDSSSMEFVDRLESKQTGFTRLEREKLIQCRGVRPAREYISDAIEPVKDKNNFTKLNYWLTKVALPDDMLCKIDRASMAHSLETRTPFLDHRILELLAAVSMRIKLKGFQRKVVLRHTIAKRLPSEVLRASKRGFSIPLYEWLRSGAVEQVERKAIQSAESGLLSLDTIKSIVLAHKYGRGSTANAIWALSMLAGHVS